MRRKTPLVAAGQRLPLLNISLFVVFAMSGYVQYFLHGSPPEQSLWIGIAFTLILVIYLYLLHHRQQPRPKRKK